MDTHSPTLTTDRVPAAGRAPAAVAIDVRGLTKRYGPRAAVDDATFQVPCGTVTGLVGPNGAGKTTTIRMLLGLVRPSAGSGAVLGHPLGAHGAYLPRVGALIEGPAFTPALSGRDNLRVLARLGGLTDERIREVLDIVGLTDRADDATRSYSLGMRQRLGIAGALLPSPDLLVLDEPTNGLDPAGIIEIRGMLRALAAGGMSVVVSSHLLGEIEAACSHLVMLVRGRIVFAGELEAFLSTRSTVIRLTPDSPPDIRHLEALCADLGLPAHPDGGDLLVDAPPSRAAELNRLAMDRGVTLRGLGVEVPSLEEAFLEVEREEGA